MGVGSNRPRGPAGDCKQTWTRRDGICSLSCEVKVEDGPHWAGRRALHGGIGGFRDRRGLPGIVWERRGLWRTVGEC